MYLIWFGHNFNIFDLIWFDFLTLLMYLIWFDLATIVNVPDLIWFNLVLIVKWFDLRQGDLWPALILMWPFLHTSVMYYHTPITTCTKKLKTYFFFLDLLGLTPIEGGDMISETEPGSCMLSPASLLKCGVAGRSDDTLSRSSCSDMSIWLLDLKYVSWAHYYNTICNSNVKLLNTRLKTNMERLKPLSDTEK